MTGENIDDHCRDCGPTFTAFLEEMADNNKEQMAEHAKVTCPTCRKVHKYTFPDAPKASVPPASPS
jgi:hypothetical protein